MRNPHGSRRAAFVTDVIAALLAPTIALLTAEIIQFTLGVNRLGLLFLAAVTFAASLRGRRAAVIAAFAGMVCYKLFLDLRTGQETTPVEDLINLVIFLVVALITGTLAGRAHDEGAKTRRHAARMELLFQTSRSLAKDDDEELWQTLTKTLAGACDGSAAAVDASGEVRAQSGKEQPGVTEIRLAAGALQSGKQPVALNERWSLRRVIVGEAPAGGLLWTHHDTQESMEEFTELLAELASASLTRAHAQREGLRIQAAEEAGALRQALLSSISHDFRSPLAAIIGSSTSLLEYGDKFDREVQRDLLLNIQHEGERLNQFVANLLNMTRLQSGGIQPLLSAVDVGSVIAAALVRLEAHRGQRIDVKVTGSCHVEADPLLLEQAAYNILDNALKYGDPAHPISVTCAGDEHSCQIRIIDHGPGLPVEDLSGIFTSFHFARKTGQSAGTGLGLSISRGFLEAMGGSVEAQNRTDGQRGLEVIMNLPAAVPCKA